MDIKVRDLRQTDIIENENKLMVLVDDDLNLVKNITKEEFLTNVISSTENNALVQESDGNLYVNTSEIADSVQTLDDKFTEQIGDLTDLTTEDKTNLVAAINEAASTGGDGGGRNVGEIITSTLPLTDAGLHLLDGSLLQYGIYKEFIDYIANLYAENPSANYFCTESAWQSSVSTYGVCGKFVYDSVNNTVRLPKVTGKIDGTTDINALGNLEPLFVRLPNITGSVGWRKVMTSGQSASGVFSYNGSDGVYTKGSEVGGQSTGFNFAASRSSSVYSGNGSDTAIHEQAIKCFIYIVIANSTKTDIQVDIDEVVTDLNGKADTDLTNCTKPHIVETYQNGTSWYRVYSDGWCEQGGFVNNNTAIKQITLLKSYSNTNYSVVALSKYSRTDDTLYQPHVDGFTNSSFYLASYGERGGATNTNGEPVLWRACGYIN